MAGHARPVVAEVGRDRLHEEQREQRGGQGFELGRGAGPEMKHRGDRDTPSIDHRVPMLEMRLRHQQNVEDVFEGQRKRERQRELEDAHDGAARHQPQMRPHVTEESHQGSARNEAIESRSKKPRLRWSGSSGAPLGSPDGTIHRLRRTGNHSRTTIWHARSLAVAQEPENRLLTSPCPRRGRHEPKASDGRGTTAGRCTARRCAAAAPRR